jgi:hypothetical protein
VAIIQGYKNKSLKCGLYRATKINHLSVDYTGYKNKSLKCGLYRATKINHLSVDYTGLQK